MKKLIKLFNDNKTIIRERIRRWQIDLSEWYAAFYKIRMIWKIKFGGFDSEYQTTYYPNYKIVFEDNFNGPEVDKLKWDHSLGWGILHPGQPWTYISEECANIVDNKLELTTKYLPKDVTHGGIEYEPLYGFGNIIAKRKFNKGIFEIRCILPKEAATNPAFWTFGTETWPPEIDVFEVFPSKSKQMTMTVHWQVPPHVTHEMNNSKVYLPMSVTDEMNTYTMIWTDEVIEILFNGVTVRKVINKNVIAHQSIQLNNLVIGNGFHGNARPEVDGPCDENKMIIDYIRVWEKD